VVVGPNGTITITLHPDVDVCPDRVYDPETTLVFVGNSLQVVGAGTESFLVVNSPLALANGTDIDANNDQVIDPSRQINVVDGIAVTINDAQQAAYAPVVFDAATDNPEVSTDLPDGVSRCPEDQDPLDEFAWVYGELVPPPAGDDARTYGGVTNASPGYAVTPGALNMSCVTPAPTPAPTLAAYGPFALPTRPAEHFPTPSTVNDACS
ncbi:MAG TPA: hypothetical protein VJT15_18195, partial [Pyrinomonadaceae bacterium]|nr:hypothetical protein [Pyrinomonadaceae bacterium]